MKEVMHLEPPYFDYHWPSIEREMKRCPERWNSWTTTEQLYAMVQMRTVQIWAAGDEKQHHLLVATQIIAFPYRRLQVLFALGNNMKEYIELLNGTLEKFAIMQGCEEAEVFGRRGWEKLLEPLGFKTRSIVMSKKIEMRSVH